MRPCKCFWGIIALVMIFLITPGCEKKSSAPQKSKAGKAITEVDTTLQHLMRKFATEKAIFEKEKAEFFNQIQKEREQVEQLRVELSQRAAELDSIELKQALRQVTLSRYRVVSWVIFVLGTLLLVTGIVMMTRIKGMQKNQEPDRVRDLDLAGQDKIEPEVVELTAEQARVLDQETEKPAPTRETKSAPGMEPETEAPGTLEETKPKSKTRRRTTGAKKTKTPPTPETETEIPGGIGDDTEK